MNKNVQFAGKLEKKIESFNFKTERMEKSGGRN